jgi:CRP/FNR family transcriptional regulator, cyclic AMP receptor protein
MTKPSAQLAKVRPLLKKAAFLAGLPDSAIETLANRGQLRQYRKGEMIYRRGEPGDSIMIIVSGRVKLTNVSAGGKEVVLFFLTTGDIYGEIAALDGQERAANAVALDAAQVFLVQTRDLMAALTAYPQAMFEVIKSLCVRVRLGAAMIEDSLLEMRGRTAKGLLRLARQHGRQEADGVSLQLTISQEDLGKHIGLTRANVSRQLSQLKDAGVIKVDGSQITITDQNGLTEIAEMVAARE